MQTPAGRLIKTGLKITLAYTVVSTMINLGNEVIRLTNLARVRSELLADEREIIAEVQMEYPITIEFIQTLQRRNQRRSSVDYDADESDVPQT